VVQLNGSLQRIFGPLGAPEEEWAAALRKALGTTSAHFLDASVRRLMAASVIPGECVPTTISLSAALALVQSMEAENEVQAALAETIRIAEVLWHARARRPY